MLERLAASAGSNSARDELADAYSFLRDVEHRVQMVADEQRHSLPQSPEGVRRSSPI